MFDRFFVGGEWVIPSRGARVRVTNPATGEPFSSVPKGTEGDARAAIHAARAAFDGGDWSRPSPSERAAALRRFAVEATIDRVRLTETTIAETGCTARDAAALLVDPVLDAMSFYADRATADPERRLPDHAGPPPAASVLRREPAGVLAAIGAAAEPPAALVHPCFAALAAGNTVVFKPSSLAPLSAMILAECAARAGLPPGVFNVVTGPGRGVGGELASNPLVDAVSFTVRVATARRVAERAASTLKITALHGGTGALALVLGGSVEDIVPRLMRSWLSHQGQAAGATTRLVVDRRLHDELVERMAAEVKGLVVGPPERSTTDVGPMRSSAARDRCERLIGDATDRGATLVCGGGRPEHLGSGAWLEPAILTGVTTAMEIAVEEPGGPVLAVLDADGPENALALAQATGAARAVHVWAARREDAWSAGRALRTATVFVDGGGDNPWAPAGAYGRAGVSRERTMDSFVEIKHLSAPD